MNRKNDGVFKASRDQTCVPTNTSNSYLDHTECFFTREDRPTHNFGANHYLAGPWVLPPKEFLQTTLRGSPTKADLTITPYHWSDPVKRSGDYNYLQGFYENVLRDLTLSLNAVHSVDKSEHYWEVILGSWLLSHVAVCYDRWEIVKETPLFASEAKVDIISNFQFRPPRDYLDYVKKATSCHIFNGNLLRATRHYQLTRELDWNYELNIDEFGCSGAGVLPSVSPNPSWVKKKKGLEIITLGKSLISKLSESIASQQRVLFVDSYIPLWPRCKLQLSLRQTPVSDSKFFSAVNNYSVRVCPTLRNQFKTELMRMTSNNESSFERYFIESLVYFIPQSALEAFLPLKEKLSDRFNSAQVIVTANAHFGNEAFKIWAAEASESGARLVVAEHGGSFPLRDYLFNFQERIADVAVNSMFIDTVRDVNVRPPSYLGRQSQALRSRNMKPRLKPFKRRRLLVVPYQGTEFALRVDSQPMSALWIETASDTIRFLNALNPNIKKHIILKAHPGADNNFDAASMIQSNLDAASEISTRRLSREIRTATLIVCTYPQTTFAEAMLSGTPTILVFDPSINIVHPKFQFLLDELEEAQVVFYEPESAAQHVDGFMTNTWDWWSSSKTLKARRTMIDALGSTTGDGVWSWFQLLQEQLSHTKGDEGNYVR